MKRLSLAVLAIMTCITVPANAFFGPFSSEWRTFMARKDSIEENVIAILNEDGRRWSPKKKVLPDYDYILAEFDFTPSYSGEGISKEEYTYTELNMNNTRFGTEFSSVWDGIKECYPLQRKPEIIKDSTGRVVRINYLDDVLLGEQKIISEDDRTFLYEIVIPEEEGVRPWHVFGKASKRETDGCYQVYQYSVVGKHLSDEEKNHWESIFTKTAVPLDKTILLYRVGKDV